jgi:vacuolar-type H+-ATPase subunit I/STV1
LDKVVETYVNENRISIDESVEIEKAKAMLEGLDSIIYTAGKSVIEIQESMSDKKTDSTVAELKAKIDSLVKENNTLKESQKTKEKENILEEVAKDLTLVQRDSFDRLAKIVSLNESDMGIYRASLEKIKGEVVGKVEESLNEKVQDKTPEKNHKRFF